MRDVVSKFDINGQLLVDFYDRQRVASWVSQHPSLMAWVRKKVGREIQGWRSYDNWSNCPTGIDEDYLIDDQDVRLVKKFNGSKQLTIETGLNEIREQLLKPSSIVRLIGLSGVGKTRFVQALFDKRLGIKALSTTQALYTDVSESPNPSPKQVLEELIIKKQQAILIIDNCAPELHKSLTEVLKASKSSSVSLLTIEYDVREEHSEETEVFALEPASEQLISKVIQTRYPNIDNGGAWHIAKLSGGNFRIANALASVINKGENISLLSDKNLFSRLFKQRNDHDNSLEVAAEVCSLVYSFNSDTSTGENLEITLLSELAEMSTRQLYRQIGELKSRELVQSRGYFRAILPHALANRLAATALEKVPMYDIKETFEVKADWRLFRSFAKRLSYLHSSEIAIEFAKRWTEEQGILEKLLPIDEKKMHLLECLAPLNQDLVLSLLEKVNQSENSEYFFSRSNEYFYRLASLLAHLAYEPIHFDKSVRLLIKIVLSEKPNENTNSVKNILKPLFQMYLSRSHATLQQRLSIINDLIFSSEKTNQEIGMELLETALEGWHFTSFSLSDFGGHIRDLGYQPKIQEERNEWYKTVFDYCLSIIDQGIEKKLKHIIANNLRGIWSQMHSFEITEYIAFEMNKRGKWIEGWISVKSILRYDSERMSETLLERLMKLENSLRPISMEEKLQIFLMGKRIQSDLFDLFEESQEMSGTENLIVTKAKLLGKFLSENPVALDKYLAKLLQGENYYLTHVGVGLVENYINQKELWKQVKKKITSIKNIQMYKPFLNGCILAFNGDLVNEVLNELMVENNLELFIYIQTSVQVDSKGIDRLNHLLNAKQLSTDYLFSFRSIKFDGSVKAVSFNELLNLIKENYYDYDLIIHLLHDQIFSKKYDFISDKNSLELMHETLVIKFSGELKLNNQTDYESSEIIKYLYAKSEQESNYSELCEVVFEGIKSYKIFESDIDETLSAILDVRSYQFLDELFRKFKENPDFIFRDRINSGPLNVIEDEFILKWLSDRNKESESRVLMVVSNIRVFKEENGQLKWSDLAHYILEHYNHNKEILKQMQFSLFKVASFWGSFADIYEKRATLLEEFLDSDNTNLKTWSNELYQEVYRKIESIRNAELLESRNLETFEF